MENIDSIGVVDGVFSTSHLPLKWKQALKEAGVKKGDLVHVELRRLLFPILIEGYGISSSKD